MFKKYKLEKLDWIKKCEMYRWPVAGDRVVSTLDCYVERLSLESSILPLLKHTCGGTVTSQYTGHQEGVAPEVNLMECTSYTPLISVNKAAHSGFETQRRRHQKSTTGVLVAP